MSDKFPLDQRTFETRLLFIQSLFSNLYSKEDIMASCIQHKLDRSFLNYVETLDTMILKLSSEDPLKILKNMD